MGSRPNGHQGIPIPDNPIGQYTRPKVRQNTFTTSRPSHTSIKALDADTLKDLNSEEIAHIKELINERPHLFGRPGEGLRATHLVTHKLVATTDTPVRVNRHHHPPAIKEEMERQITQYLEAGIIKPSDSSYSSMMWVDPKKSRKNGEKRWRMVTDFRQFNEITVGNSYALPLTTEIIEAVASPHIIPLINNKKIK